MGSIKTVLITEKAFINMNVIYRKNKRLLTVIQSYLP